MEALFVIVPILLLITWLIIESHRHKRAADPIEHPPVDTRSLEQRAREAFDPSAWEN